jgi:hypothetical protein
MSEFCLPRGQMNSVVVSVDALEGDVTLAGRTPDNDRRVFSARRQKVLALRVVGKPSDRRVTLGDGQHVDAVGGGAGNNTQWINSPDEYEKKLT